MFPTYNSPEQLERLQSKQRIFTSFKDIKDDLFENHKFLAIPLYLFYGISMLVLFYVHQFRNDRDIDAIPSTFNEFVKNYLYKEYPFYCILMSLLMLATPVIFCIMETVRIDSSPINFDNGLINYAFSTFLILLTSIIGTSVITNILSGLLTYISIILSNAVRKIFK